MTRIDEIRERLDKATPGPWEVDTDGSGGHGVFSDDEHMNPVCLYAKSEDIDLIANAPADLAWCLRKIERLSTKLAMVSLIVDDEPDPCPEHPNDDPVTCGWKRDIISIRLILNDTKEN